MLTRFEPGIEAGSLDECNFSSGAGGIYKDLMVTQSPPYPTLLCLIVTLSWVVALMSKENPQFISDIKLQRTGKVGVPTPLPVMGRATGSSMTLDWSCSSTSSSEFQSKLCWDPWVTLEKPWLSPISHFLTWNTTDLGSSLTSFLLVMCNNLSQTSGLARPSRGKFLEFEVLDCGSAEFSTFWSPKNGKQHY